MKSKDLKRKVLTSDDLLRVQEQPSRKKAKTDFLPKRSLHGDYGSEYESEDPDENQVKASATDGSDEDDDDDTEEEVEEGGGGEDDEQDESSELDEDSAEPTNDASRIGLSRFKSNPTITTKPSEQSQTNSESPSSNTFAALGASVPLRNALKSISITAPTPVQAACIPTLLAGRDCIGNAKTGSGKTIAFALPILQKLSVDPYGLFALVLTPTRELAFQISEQFAVLGSPMNIRTAVVVGGMDMMAQALELSNRPHVVVATPGRMVDHLKSGNNDWNLSKVKFLVLDEADRLLSSTFTSDLSYLFEALPKERQTCLFTATWTPAIESVANATPKPGKQHPFIHKMTEEVETVATLKQYYFLVPSHVRESYLFYLLCNPPESVGHMRRAPPETYKDKKKKAAKQKNKKQGDDGEEILQPPPTIIFCARTKTAAYITLLLKNLSIRSTALHSRLTQRERLTSLSLFRSSVVPVLVSTDVGARGLDIDDVALVVNWDLPDEPEEYTHRVGRTARAGRSGVSMSFVTERDEERVIKVENRIGVKLNEYSFPENQVLEKLNAVSTAKRLANMTKVSYGLSQRSVGASNRFNPTEPFTPPFLYTPTILPRIMMDVTDWDSVLQFASSEDVDVPSFQERDTEFQDKGGSVNQNQMQIPTPPQSHGGSPIAEDPNDGNVLVSVSTTFFPGANNHTLPPDLALLSSDSVFFYVHSDLILAASSNQFQELLPENSPKAAQRSWHNMVVHVDEKSPVLNIILHVVYGMSCAHYSPSFETLSAAVNRLPSYGIQPLAHITTSSPLHTILLSHAPLCPLDLYTLAARHDLYDLAVSTSPHLLSLPLSSITDEIATNVGPKYLRRLFFLHIGRSDALKRLLLPPPNPHAPTPFCDFTDQKTLTRAWALASAYLAWDARPDLSTSFLESALRPLADHLSCDLCKQSLNDRIKNVLVQWSVIKRTI
ncbi:putative RNA helicase [Marasmius tenuissimus]|uniref:RNA helicase n=1 Tax=Marasmius tenuissimus TaxID=585030 RepID=A0ABR3ACU9_9AGAR